MMTRAPLASRWTFSSPSRVRLAPAVFLAAASFAVAAASNPLPTTLPPVIVEGDRFERARGEVAESHAVLGGAMLESQVAGDALGVLDRAANTSLGFAHSTPFSIRGVGNDSVTPGLLGRVAHVANLHQDGVAATPTYLDYFLPTLWDAASVTVFRGPVSTSHGVNGLIGGVFLRYVEPSFGWEGRARVQVAGYATAEAAVLQNVPLSGERAALRLAVEHRQSDGAARNVTRGTDDWARIDQDHFRAQLRWRPRGDDAVEAGVLLRHERTGSSPTALVRALGPDGSLFDRQADADTDNASHATNTLAALTLRGRLSRDSRLESITAWQSTRGRDIFDVDYTALPLVAGTSNFRERAVSQELQWRQTRGALQLLAGAYGERARHIQEYETRLRVPGLPATGTNRTQIDGTTAALFAQAVWRATPAVTLEAGLRGHHATHEVSVDSRNDGYGIPTHGERAEKVLSPRASLAWTPRAHTRFGALVSHGFRGGGVSSALLQGITRSYGPEHAWNYELFARRETADGRLWVQANAYAMNWRDQQVSATAPGGVPSLDELVFNAGRSRLRGFELEAGGRFTGRWSAFASLGHQATKFVEFVNGGANHAGEPFPNAPRWNASVTAGYGIDDTRPGPFGSATLTWRDRTYSLIGLRDFTALESRTLLSARLGWRWRGGASVYVFGENLLDDDFAYSRADWRIFGVPGPVGRPSEPRTLGVGAELAW